MPTSRPLAITLCAAVGFCAAFYYEATVNSGHGSLSPYYLGVCTALGGAFWAWLIYPAMGRSIVMEIVIIVAAFPVEGAFGGLLAAWGLPFGALGGMIVAVWLLVLICGRFGVLYTLAAVLAFWLPRRSEAALS